MSAELVNLRRERKRRRKEADRAEAEENRARHGRTAAEKLSQSMTKEREDARHEAHKRDRSS